MKTILQFAAALCLLAVGYSAVWVAHRATASLQAATATLEAAREDLAVTQAALVSISDKRSLFLA